jgi:hypothetical protein
LFYKVALSTSTTTPHKTKKCLGISLLYCSLSLTLTYGWLSRYDSDLLLDASVSAFFFKASALWLRHSNPVPSAMNSLQRFYFQSYRLFFMPKKLHQKCTNPVSTHFYGRFSNCTYFILPIPLSRSAFNTIQLSSYAATISEMVAVFVRRKNNYHYR